MYKCDSGKIAYNNNHCSLTKMCEDGLEWSEYYNSCIYTLCGKRKIAINTTCSNSYLCMEGYTMEGSQCFII